MLQKCRLSYLFSLSRALILPCAQILQSHFAAVLFSEEREKCRTPRWKMGRALLFWPESRFVLHTFLLAVCSCHERIVGKKLIRSPRLLTPFVQSSPVHSFSFSFSFSLQSHDAFSGESSINSLNSQRMNTYESGSLSRRR